MSGGRAPDGKAADSLRWVSGAGLGLFRLRSVALFSYIERRLGVDSVAPPTPVHRAPQKGSEQGEGREQQQTERHPSVAPGQRRTTQLLVQRVDQLGDEQGGGQIRDQAAPEPRGQPDERVEQPEPKKRSPASTRSLGVATA